MKLYDVDGRGNIKAPARVQLEFFAMDFLKYFDDLPIDEFQKRARHALYTLKKERKQRKEGR